MGCLKCEVELVSQHIQGVISLVCNIGSISLSIPLLVDEGYLFVEEDGETYYLCVDRVTFELKKKLKALYGDIDNENNPLYIQYEKKTLNSIEMEPKIYFSEIGEYQLDFQIDSPYANDFKSIEWTLDENLYATIDKDSGIVKVTRVDEEVADSGPNTNVYVTVTLLDGTTLKDSSNLNFWRRSVKLGDIVYHDGYVASPDDHDLNVSIGREAIGVCVYIDPEDRTKRLMVSLEQDNGSGYLWGVNTNQIPTLELADSPDFNPYDLLSIPNLNPSIGVNNLNKLRDEEFGDKDGWAIFNAKTDAAGLIGFMELLRDFMGHKEGEKIPYGLYYTLCIIEARNKVLSDSSVNLEIPYADDRKTERDVFLELHTSVKNNMGVNYTTLYYPWASLAYSYRPTKNKGLLDKFKEHNWFIPTIGEFLRMAFFRNKGISSSNIDDEFAIFAKAINSGVMRDFSYNRYFATCSEQGTNQYHIILPTTGNVIGDLKNSERRCVRFLCAF